MMSDKQKLELVQILMEGITYDDMECLTIEASLIRHQGNRTHASHELGICLRTLRNKIAKYGLGTPESYRHAKETKN